MTYEDWINAVCGLLEYAVTDATSATPTGVADFDNNWPRAVEYAELRMQRDLDFLASIVAQSGTMTPDSRKITYPTTSGRFVVVSSIIPLVGGVKQRPLEPVTRSFLDFTFPAEASLGASVLPIYWCPNDEVSALVGPAPASALACEIVGTIRFTPLSNTNTHNFLSDYLPDLYLQASMRWWWEFQQNAEMVAAAETAYTALLSSATVEEARKKFADMFPRSTKPTALNDQAA